MLESAYAMCKTGQIQRAMEDTCTVVHKLLFARDYSGCNDFISLVNPELGSPYLAIAVLRASYPVRDKLPGWGYLLTRTERVLDADECRLLRGFHR